jgi:hypothetical protein
MNLELAIRSCMKTLARQRRTRQPRRKAMTTDDVFINEDRIYAVSPEGKSASMPLAALFERLNGQRFDTGDLILPGSVKTVRSRGTATLLVLEKPPALHRLKWIAPNSRARYGPGTTYRDVTLALPYLVVFAVFVSDPAGRLTLSSTSNECFFRNEPIRSFDDQLCYPALLNCSKFRVQEGHPLAWICTQFLRRELIDRETDLNARFRAGLKELLHCLLETGFNFSSEAHEGSSWYSESRIVDPRIATVEAWQEASLQDRFFVEKLPWLKTGLSLAEMIERIFKTLRAIQPAIRTTGDLARLVFNYRASA